MIENGELVLFESIPSNFSSTEFVYLLKSPETEITAENFHNKLQSGSILGKFIILKFNHVTKTPWRNGSASDSRSEGCVFESRRGHIFFISRIFLLVKLTVILGDSVIKSLLRQMNGVYAPIFFETTSLPESICNDFSARMHRFLGLCSRTFTILTFTPHRNSNISAFETRDLSN